MSVKRYGIGPVKMTFAAKQKVRVKIWRKVVRIVRDNTDKHLHDDENDDPFQDERKSVNSFFSRHVIDTTASVS